MCVVEVCCCSHTVTTMCYTPTIRSYATHVSVLVSKHDPNFNTITYTFSSFSTMPCVVSTCSIVLIHYGASQQLAEVLSISEKQGVYCFSDA